MQRRTLLKATTSLPLTALFGMSAISVKAEISEPDFRVIEVPDNIADPVLKQGQLVMVDTGMTSFDQTGMYLYPAWGQPRVYQVSLVGDKLHFTHPGQTQLLWAQARKNFEGETRFAGKALGVTTQAQLVQAEVSWTPLDLSAFPI